MSNNRASEKSGLFVPLTNILIVLFALPLAGVWGQFADNSQEKIISLIGNLESDDFKIRESAEQALIRVGVPAARLLAEQVIVGSPESAMRSARILQEVGVRAKVESDMMRLSCAMDYLANNGFPYFRNSAGKIASRWKIEQADKIRAQIRECGIDFSDGDPADPFMQPRMQVLRGGGFIIVENGAVIDDSPIEAAPEVRRSIRSTNERLSAGIEEIFQADESIIKQRMQLAVMEQESVAATSPSDPFGDDLPDLDAFGISGFNQPSATVGKVNENTRKGLELMRLLPSVPQIAFNECEIPDDVVDQLARVPGLQVISLMRCKYDPASVLKLLESKPNVTMDVTGHEAFLGVSVQPNILVIESGEEKQVCEVQTVVEESAAAAAGVQVGDHILEIDGLRIAEFNHLIVCIASHQIGDEVTLKFESNGEVREVKVTLRLRSELD